MKRPAPELFVLLVFAGILLSAGTLQLGLELGKREAPQVFDILKDSPTVPHLRAYEKRLEEASWLARRLRPWMQYFQFALLGDAGEKVVRGPGGWFFYKPGVDYLTQREPAGGGGTGEAVRAICAFRDQLAARGMHLVVIPAPNKESVYPEQLSRRAAGLSLALGEPTRALLEKLGAAGVEVVNLFELFARAKAVGEQPGTSHLYLAQDSHWSPAGLELAAQEVGRRLLARGWLEPGNTLYQTRRVEMSRMGDVVRMMKVPRIENCLDEEKAVCVQVIDPDTLKPFDTTQPGSRILVLGDSFLRIFQNDEPGSAGFIAHLARELRQPVAAIVNDGGASTLVRQELHRRPALLENKKVVIWEFVERDIRFGTEGWKSVPLPPATGLAGAVTAVNPPPQP